MAEDEARDGGGDGSFERSCGDDGGVMTFNVMSSEAGDRSRREAAAADWRRIAEGYKGNDG